MHNRTAHYDDKLSAGCGYKYMKCNAVDHSQQPANNQPYESWKKALSGISTRVHHRLPRLTLLPVSPLGKLLRRLGPQVEVNQRGWWVLQRWRWLFSLAHTDKLCTHSHDVNVRAYLSNSFSVPFTTECLVMDIGLIAGYVEVVSDLVVFRWC